MWLVVRILVVALAAAALLGACGGDDDAESSGDDLGGESESPVATSPPVATTAPTPTPEEQTAGPAPPASPDEAADALREAAAAGEPPDAVVLQSALASLCLYTGEIDGDVGPMTTEAVREFQAGAGLDVDGIVGPMTTAALAEALASTPSTCPDESFSSELEISATVDGVTVVFDRDIECRLGDDDAGALSASAADGRLLEVTLDGTASRVRISGGESEPIDAELTLVTNTTSTIQIQASPPQIELFVPLSLCSSL